MRIAVIGCGIGGLAAANFLTSAAHDVIVFDQFDEARPVGSGLVIQPVGMHVLDKLGLSHKALVKGARTYHMYGLEAESGRRVLDVAYGEKGGEHFGLGIHRASLFDILYQEAIRLKVNIEHSSQVVHTTINDDFRFLTLSNGMQSGPFDLVIDASGVQSIISPLYSKELSFGAIWGTVDWPDQTSLDYHRLEQRYYKARNMIGILPIGTLPGESQRKAALFWSLPKRDFALWCSTSLDHWQLQAETLWPELSPFIQQIKNHDQMTMARYSHGQMRKPYEEKLVYIGDSAHRASPQLGQGANMALLDAYALSCCVEQYNIKEALKQYAKSRRNHVMAYQALSWAFTPMYQSNSRALPFIRDNIMAPLSRVSPVAKMLTSLVKGTMINPLRGL